MRLYSTRVPIFFLIFLVLQCAGSRNYIRDRGNDLGDIVSVSFDAGLGVSASLGPLTGGLGIHNVIVGCKYAYCGDYSNLSGTALLGWKDRYLLHKEDFYKFDDEYFAFRKKLSFAPESKNGYFPVSNYGRIRLRIGILFGFSMEFNFLEFADFLLGIGGLDILEDDWNEYYDNLSRNSKTVPNQIQERK